jgi:hypothetical protein
MDLVKKLDYARSAVNSISRHDDEDAAVRKIMLDQVVAHVQAEQAAIDARVAERLAQMGVKSEAAQA